MKQRGVWTAIACMGLVAALGWAQTFPVRIDEAPPEFPEPDSGILPVPGLVVVDSEEKVVGEVVSLDYREGGASEPDRVLIGYIVPIRLEGEVIFLRQGPGSSTLQIANLGYPLYFTGVGCTGEAYILNANHFLKHRNLGDSVWVTCSP